MRNLMTGPIQGKVAQILTARDLIVNIGRQEGVVEDMVFAVLNPRGSSVHDPDTGEILGSIPLPKIFVRIAVVQDRLALARTYRTIVRGGTAVGIPSIFVPGTVEIETLRRQDHSESAELDEEDSIVRIGDPVVQVLNPDEVP